MTINPCEFCGRYIESASDHTKECPLYQVRKPVSHHTAPLMCTAHTIENRPDTVIRHECVLHSHRAPSQHRCMCEYTWNNPNTSMLRG